MSKSDTPTQIRKHLYRNCLQGGLKSYVEAVKENKTCYITADLSPSYFTEDDYDFFIGDGKVYGGYQNAPVTGGESYHLFVGVIAISGVMIYVY
jgi:hypothetical protein